MKSPSELARHAWRLSGLDSSSANSAPPWLCVTPSLRRLQVLVLMLRESQQEEAAAAIRAEDEIEGLDNAYIVSFIVPDIEDAEEGNGDILPTKALLNAVSDLCQTR